MKIKVSDLQPGQEFRQIGQRKYRKVKSINTFKPTDLVPDQVRDKMLIVLENCNQIILPPDAIVEIILPQGEQPLAMQNRCMYCDAEQYSMNVIAVSRGVCPCLKCGKYSMPMSQADYAHAMAKLRAKREDQTNA